MMLKHGVNPDGVCREIWWALGLVGSIADRYEIELVATSMNDGTHGQGSKHYVGEAADIRTRDLKTYDHVHLFFWEIKGEIDKYGFDTVLEKDHIHIEYDPKIGEKFFEYIE